jgi:hypothetical protein
MHSIHRYIKFIYIVGDSCTTTQIYTLLEYSSMHYRCRISLQVLFLCIIILGAFFMHYQSLSS